MHAIGFLSQWLAEHTVIQHRARQEALLKLVQALLSGGKLSLTQLGRHRAGEAYPKHQIKAADRLLGNVHLYRERQRIYGALAQTVLAGIRRPVILVDWSDTDPGQRWYLLKAAVAVRGRALSIYEKVYPLKDYNTRKAHREFLQALKTILPDDCNPFSSRMRDSTGRGSRPSKRSVGTGLEEFSATSNTVERTQAVGYLPRPSIHKRRHGSGTWAKFCYRANTDTAFVCTSSGPISRVAGGLRGRAFRAAVRASIGSSIELRGCSPPRFATSQVAHVESNDSMRSECKSRRLFVTRSATAGASAFATPTARALEGWKSCC